MGFWFWGTGNCHKDSEKEIKKAVGTTEELFGDKNFIPSVSLKIFIQILFIFQVGNPDRKSVREC